MFDMFKTWKVVGMARDFASSAYQRIAAEYAEKIDKGELAHGVRLPTRKDLTERYGVSLQVIRDALALLHTDGYIRSETSQGTFVQRLPRLTMSMDFEADERPVDAFDALVRSQGHEPSQDIAIETVLAGAPSVPPGLGLSDGERIVVRRRLRYVDEVPYSISDSFFPESLVNGSPVTSPENITEGGRHVLAELGLAMTRHRDVIESRRAHNTEVQRLGIAPGVAVMAHTRVSCTRYDVPIRVLATVLPSDRWTLTYEVSQ